MMPLVGSVFRYGILHWFFSALKFTYLLCMFSAEMNDFNPFFEVSEQKIIFLNLKNLFKNIVPSERALVSLHVNLQV